MISGFLPYSLTAQSESTMTLDDRINGIMEPITNVIMKVIFVEVSIGWGPVSYTHLTLPTKA